MNKGSLHEQAKERRQIFVRVKNMLDKHVYIRAREIASALRIKTTSVYHLIKKMRQGGYKIVSSNKGYVFCDKATRFDIMCMLNRYYSIRNSQNFIIETCKPDIYNQFKRNDRMRADFAKVIGPLAPTKAFHEGRMMCVHLKSNFHGSL